MSVLRLPDPFTHHIFVDADSQCTSALSRRAAPLTTLASSPIIITGDVNKMVGHVKKALPRYSKKETVLSFCFVDPFDVSLNFDTIRALSAYQMDFLVLLALGVDLRRNLRRCYEADSSTRIADFIDCPTWRTEFNGSGERITRFVLRKFDTAMVRLGYLSSDQAHPVKVSGGGVLLYYLVYYSKHKLGPTFWKSTLKAVTGQGELALGL
jgi:three-Cys-motif partner protein